MTDSADTPTTSGKDTPNKDVISMSPAKPKAPATKPKPLVADAVVGEGETDDVLFSRAVPVTEAKTRKSLTIHHLQRRLTYLGYPEAGSDLDGRWGSLTESAVHKWQESNGHEPGRLTAPQFRDIFENDPNVTVVLDLPY